MRDASGFSTSDVLDFREGTSSLSGLGESYLKVHVVRRLRRQRVVKVALGYAFTPLLSHPR